MSSRSLQDQQIFAWILVLLQCNDYLAITSAVREEAPRKTFIKNSDVNTDLNKSLKYRHPTFCCVAIYLKQKGKRSLAISKNLIINTTIINENIKGIYL